jgi:putative NIF3 family GTP cyclohydrolase 1 type 2
LDITNKVVQTAIKNKIDLIISHHPIFLNSKEIETNKYEFKLISMIKKHRIGLVSYHTNIDNNKYGLNYFISSLISNNIKYIKKTPLYRIKGVFNLTKLKKIFKKFTCNTFKYVGNQKTFKSLVLCSGAGFSVLKQNINKLNKEDL